jgi:15-cis-phytoene synthase
VNTPVSGEITRKSASNLALAFVLLPKAKRSAMTALYAFCREVDDVADEDTATVEKRRAVLEEWRVDIRNACAGGRPHFTVVRELQPFVAQYGLRAELFEALLDGVEMDIEPRRYADMSALEIYCHHVASVVGLLSIEIFGYKNVACREYAESLGKALQLTNILRDIGNDARRGRIYLPSDVMAQARVTDAEIFSRLPSDRFITLCRIIADRARMHYRAARTALPREDRASMATAELMGAVYWQLLEKLDRLNFPVLGDDPYRLKKGEKIALTLKAWLWQRAGLTPSPYGG